MRRLAASSGGYDCQLSIWHAAGMLQHTHTHTLALCSLFTAKCKPSSSLPGYGVQGFLTVNRPKHICSDKKALTIYSLSGWHPKEFAKLLVSNPISSSSSSSESVSPSSPSSISSLLLSLSPPRCMTS